MNGDRVTMLMGDRAGLMFFFKEFEVLAVSFLFQIFFRDKSQGGRIQTVAEARRRRTVFKNITEMGISMLASHLGSS
jgi:hypothetical protein